MYIILTIIAIISVIFFSKHLFSKRHSNFTFIAGSCFLVVLLVFLPFALKEYSNSANETEYQTILEALDFYGTAIGLLSSLFLGYIAFRISRNENQRNNSSSISMESLECRPLFLKDVTYTKKELPKKSNKGYIGNKKYVKALVAKSTNDTQEEKITADGYKRSFVREFNTQTFTNVSELRKLTNGRHLRISKFDEIYRSLLKKRLDRLSKKPKGDLSQNYKYQLTLRRYSYYTDYASMPESTSNKVLSFKMRNKGPASLQQISLYFPKSNCVFTSYFALDQDEEKCKFLGLPDASENDEVVYVTFISCYNERTYGEFKLSKIVIPEEKKTELADSTPKELADVTDKDIKKRYKNSEFFTIRHFHFYGFEDHK